MLQLAPLARQSGVDTAPVKRARQLVDEPDRFRTVEQPNRTLSRSSERPRDIEHPHRPIVGELHHQPSQCEVEARLAQAPFDRSLAGSHAEQDLRLVNPRKCRCNRKPANRRLGAIPTAPVPPRGLTYRFELEERFHTSIIAPG